MSLISTFTWNPALLAFEYFGYAFPISGLDNPVLVVAFNLPSTNTLTSFTPDPANAHPLTVIVFEVTAAPSAGSSILPTVGKLSTTGSLALAIFIVLDIS